MLPFTITGKEGNTRPIGLHQHLQSNNRTPNFKLHQNIVNGKFNTNNTENVAFRFPSSNANVHSIVGNYSSLNWNIDNTENSQNLIAYLYNAESEISPNSKLQDIRRVKAGEIMQVNLPIRNSHIRTEYKRTDFSSSNANVNVRMIGTQFSPFSNDIENYKTYDDFKNSKFVRNTSSYYDDIALSRVDNHKIISLHAATSNLAAGVSQMMWDSNEPYDRIIFASPINVENSNPLDQGLTFQVKGLDEFGNEIKEAVVIGATTVPLTKNYQKINEAICVGNSGLNDIANQGIISFKSPTYGLQAVIAPNAGKIENIKYCVPEGYKLLVKDIFISGLCGSHTVQFDFYISPSIYNALPRRRFYEFTAHDNENIENVRRDLNIILDETNELYGTITPITSPTQQNIFTINVNCILYEKIDENNIQDIII